MRRRKHLAGIASTETDSFWWKWGSTGHCCGCCDVVDGSIGAIPETHLAQIERGHSTVLRLDLSPTAHSGISSLDWIVATNGHAVQ
jgi:hypothetical protein